MVNNAQELCTSCAFLGERDGHGDVVEALPAYRQAPSTTQNRNDRSGGTPVCIMGKRSFRAEYDAIYSRKTRERPGYGINSQEAIQEVLATPPDCGTWAQYLEGITPKERREMLDRADLMKFQADQDFERRMFQAAQRDIQQAHDGLRDDLARIREDERDARMLAREDARDAISTARYIEQMTTVRNNHRRELWVYGGVLAVATLVAGVIQAGWMPEPSWLEHWRWWPF